MKLRDDADKHGKVKGKLDTVFGDLLDVDADKALQLCDWHMQKTQLFMKHINGLKYHRLPNDMKRGDIVLVKLGVNIGAELSDTNENSEGHFGLIWAQQGQQFTIIPLTKKIQPKDNIFGVNLGVIKGLPKKTNSDGTEVEIETYAKIDGIRSVHLRRLHRINGVVDGKVQITDPSILKKISDVFKNNFIIE